MEYLTLLNHPHRCGWRIQKTEFRETDRCQWAEVLYQLPQNLQFDASWSIVVEVLVWIIAVVAIQHIDIVTIRRGMTRRAAHISKHMLQKVRTLQGPSVSTLIEAICG